MVDLLVGQAARVFDSARARQFVVKAAHPPMPFLIEKDFFFKVLCLFALPQELLQADQLLYSQETCQQVLSENRNKQGI